MQRRVWALLSRGNNGNSHAMEVPSEQGKTPDMDARLARVEALLAAEGDRPDKTPVQRALKYLPLLAVSNFLVAVPAFVLSVVVAYFTFIGAEATEKMQIASVWPHVAYETTNQAEAAVPMIRLSLTNKGVGPAKIENMEIRYDGRAYGGFRELLAACCSDAPAGLAAGMGSVVGEVLRPGDDLMFAQLGRDVPSDAAWTRFDKERLKLDVRVCYCSVFEDCWISDSASAAAAPVASCPTNWTSYYGASGMSVPKQ